MSALRVGIVGARGYVGGELIRRLAAHPQFELAYVTSRELVGQPLSAHIVGYAGDVHYTSPAYAELPELEADAVVLALPNGKAAHIAVSYTHLYVYKRQMPSSAISKRWCRSIPATRHA